MAMAVGLPLLFSLLWAEAAAAPAEVAAVVGGGAVVAGGVAAALLEGEAAAAPAEVAAIVEAGATAAEAAEGAAVVTEGADTAVLTQSVGRQFAGTAAKYLMYAADAEMVGEAGYDVVGCHESWTDQVTQPLIGFELKNVNKNCWTEDNQSDSQAAPGPMEKKNPTMQTGPLNLQDDQVPESHEGTEPKTESHKVSEPKTESHPLSEPKTVGRHLETSTQYEYPIVPIAALLAAGVLVSVVS